MRDKHKYVYFKYRISFKSVFHRSPYLLSIEKTFFSLSVMYYIYFCSFHHAKPSAKLYRMSYRFTFSILILNLFLVFNVLDMRAPSFCISVFSHPPRGLGNIRKRYRSTRKDLLSFGFVFVKL